MLFDINIDPNTHKEFYSSCLPLAKEILSIIGVLKSNCNIYCEYYWEISKKEISLVCDQLNNIFSENDYIAIWEQSLKCKYKYTDFKVVICNSIQGGPQAIDISHDKDIFALNNDYYDFLRFVSHEFGIYLLKEILSDTNAFKDLLSNYKAIESLAEFYNRTISGGYNNFYWYDDYLRMYENIIIENPSITIKEMFLLATNQK